MGITHREGGSCVCVYMYPPYTSLVPRPSPVWKVAKTYVCKINDNLEAVCV